MLDVGHLLLAATGQSSTLVTLAVVVVLAIGSQWLAWHLRVPSILVLLIVGFMAGPVTEFLKPDDLIQPQLLFPMVSLAVALILFEGGLTLQLSELRTAGSVIRNLCTIGALVTGVLTTAAAYFFLNAEFAVALILGSLLVVTGPTVVGPLLHHIRPAGKVGTIAKWEGIVIDPVGAMFAVLALASIEAVQASGVGGATWAVGEGLVKTIFWGGLCGVVAAWPTIYLLRRFLIPDYLESPMLLMLVVACFAVADHFQPEAGLFAVTLMGVVLVNQKQVPIKHIINFKENLRVLLISLLFIVLAARIQMSTLDDLGWGSLAFVAALMLVIRPLAVWISTIGSGLNWREKLFLSWLAPRGIVAAALASVAGNALEGMGNTGGQLLAPVTFLVIVATVATYGLTAAPLARYLELASPNPQGVLFASAHPGARAIASAIQDADFPVLMVDSNRHNIQTASLEGLPALYASILSEHALEEMELGGIGRLLAVTGNDEVNLLAVVHYSEVFGRAEVYRLVQSSQSSRVGTADEVMRGRRLFAKHATYDYLDDRFADGAIVKKTKLTEAFGYDEFFARYGEDTLLLFTISENGKLNVNTVGQPITPKSGDVVIALVEPVRDETEEVATG